MYVFRTTFYRIMYVTWGTIVDMCISTDMGGNTLCICGLVDRRTYQLFNKWKINKYQFLQDTFWVIYRKYFVVILFVEESGIATTLHIYRILEMKRLHKKLQSIFERSLDKSTILF